MVSGHRVGWGGSRPHSPIPSSHGAPLLLFTASPGLPDLSSLRRPPCLGSRPHHPCFSLFPAQPRRLPFICSHSSMWQSQELNPGLPVRFKAQVLNHDSAPSLMETSWLCASPSRPRIPPPLHGSVCRECLHDCRQVAVEGPSVSHHHFPWHYFLMMLQAAGMRTVQRLRTF